MAKNHPLIRKRMGLREIARELNKKGVPTTRGGKWFNSFKLNICIKNIYFLYRKYIMFSLLHPVLREMNYNDQR